MRKKMKKIKLCKGLLCLLALTILSTNSNNTLEVSASEDVDLTPDFVDDFESYTVDGDGTDLNVKWTNGWFEKTGDGNETLGSNEYFKVTKDPLNPNNKVLYIDTYSNNNSFFYLTMKDLMVKNFILTYDFYMDYPGGSPWFGITCRKPIDGRYNGVSNMHLTTRIWGETAISTQFYKCVYDSHAALETTSGSGYSAGQYAEDNLSTLNKVWLNVKISVIDSEFKIYINDHFVGMTKNDKSTTDVYGLCSFVSCVNKTYIDNVHLQNLDEEPYNPEGDSSTPTIKAPEMTTTEYTYVKDSDLTVNVSLFGEAVTEVKQANNVVLTKYYTVDGDTITFAKEYLNTLSTGKKSFLISTAGGSKMFYIIISSEENKEPDTSTSTSVPDSTPDSTTSTNTSDDTTTNEPIKRGCKSSVGFSGLTMVALLGCFLLKKKKTK